MKTLLAVVFVTALAQPCPSANGRSYSPNSSPKDIVGTWALVAYEDHPDGSPTEYPYGPTPVGLLIYDATGHMAVQIMKVPHPKVASGDEEKVSSGEKLALFDAYTAYFGSYSVDWKTKIVTHRVEADMCDVYVGTAQKRHFELQGDRLTLSDSWTREGHAVRGLRVFERVKPR
jgi:hypothetical protein